MGSASLLCVEAVTCGCGCCVDSAAVLALSAADCVAAASAVVDVGSVAAALACDGTSLVAGATPVEGFTVAAASDGSSAEVLAGGAGGACWFFEAAEGAVAELVSGTEDKAVCATADEAFVTSAELDSVAGS